MKKDKVVKRKKTNDLPKTESQKKVKLEAATELYLEYLEKELTQIVKLREDLKQRSNDLKQEQIDLDTRFERAKKELYKINNALK